VLVQKDFAMTTPVSRRQFLGTSAGSAVALAAGPLLAQADALPSRTVTVGIMGLNRGMQVAAALEKQPGVVIKYVCDVDSKRAEQAKSQLEKSGEQRPLAIADFRTILDDREVDALFCEAPNHWHGPATILGCAAGKHVYVEKPCCHNPWEGEQMVAAARKQNRAVQMGVQRRSTPGVMEAVVKLQQGIIGNVYCARGWYNNSRPTLGTGQQSNPPATLDYDLWQGPAPRAPYFDNRIHYNWHWFWNWGNGELGNNGVHALDLCRWGLNVEFPSVVASSGGRYRFQDDQQTPDTHVASFEFPGGKQITWQGLSCNKHQDSTGYVSFYGDKGSLSLGQFGDYKIYDANDRQIEERADDAGGKNPWLAVDTFHTANFIAAIRSGEHFGVSAQIEKGHRSTLLCHLGNIAYRTQRTLKCNPENGHILDDTAAMAFWQREYEPGWKPIV
jgi:predicted dehydrogenase